MQCSKCGSDRDYPTSLTHEKGRPQKPGQSHSSCLADENPFEGNYLGTTPEQTNRLMPVVPDMVSRKAPAAAVLAAPS